MTAYYNENDPYAAQWLRNLIEAGHIAAGVVDERSILNVRPDELMGYTQCHFFAGIGVWSYALRQAGWSDSRPVWTGSCPCQPFSNAGNGAGFADERHLWPAWFHLIQHGKHKDIPILGEQVASKDGYAWLDLVQADLEGAGYTCWPVVLPAAGFGAPHIRHRQWFIAKSRFNEIRDSGYCGSNQRLGYTSGARLSERISDGGIQQETLGTQSREAVVGTSDALGLAKPHGEGSQSRGKIAETSRHGDPVISACSNGWLADAELSEHEKRQAGGSDSKESEGWEQNTDKVAGRGGTNRPGPTNGYWRDPDWLFCQDGKWRPVRSGSSPLADGPPARVGRLRAYGNAINAEAAKEVISCCMEILGN